MHVPFVATRVEQRYNLPGFGINASNIRPLVVIARQTGQTKVTGPCTAPVLFCNNMVYRKGKAVVDLQNSAILTTVARSLHTKSANAISMCFQWLLCLPMISRRDLRERGS